MTKLQKKDHEIIIAITSSIFTSITAVYKFKCSVFDKTINSPTDIEFIFYTGFVSNPYGYYFFVKKFYDQEFTIKMHEMEDKETVRKLISY